ncbi:MAG TPA: orotate phosphoribosyltransferase [Thermoanaerobaculia bacterium]|nr:orotate phosphoribosyltransferase [Thermoanaerobaculia bacterium]
MTSDARTATSSPEALSAAELEGLLAETGALRRGHFILSSGLHSPVYVQCALLLQYPGLARRVGSALARRLASLRPDSVLAPALGGLIIGHEVASALDVPCRFTERQGGEMKLRRSFALAPGERVVIIEDVITTGKSTRETAALAEAAGAEVVAVGAIIDRSGGPNPFAQPFFSLMSLSAPVYDPASGEALPDWGPAEKPGSRSS